MPISYTNIVGQVITFCFASNTAILSVVSLIVKRNPVRNFLSPFYSNKLLPPMSCHAISRIVAQLYATSYNSNGDSYAHKNKKQCSNLRKIFTIMYHSVLKSLIKFQRNQCHTY